MSLSLLQGFQFEMKDTFVHRLDPRTKITISLVYFLLAIMFETILPLLFLFLSLLPLVFLSQITKKWLQTMRGLGIFVSLILIINTLVQGFSFAIAMILRILVLMTAFSIFFLTVHPDDLALAMVAMKMPYNFAFSMSLAFRFVPTLAEEAQMIIDAQQSRGLELREGNLLQRMKNLIPIIIPLVVCSIRRALQVAESLDARAFGTTKDRQSLKTIEMKIWDWLLVISFMGLLIFGVVVRYFLFEVFPLIQYNIPL